MSLYRSIISIAEGELMILNPPERGIIGCIHLLPLPGAPRYEGNMKAIVRMAMKEAALYERSGVSGILLENTHDVPYTRGYAAPETVAAMTAVASEVRAMTQLPIGIQILAGAAIESLAVAVASDLQFLRVEGFSFAHVADEGLIQSCAAALLRKRAELHATHIKVFADIKKKHASHAITADLSIGDTARAAQFMQADGVIVTGKMTGEAPDEDELREVREATPTPVWIGSGMTEENLDLYAGLADCLVVGSAFKEGGRWMNMLDPARLDSFIRRYQELHDEGTSPVKIPKDREIS
jgi:uncharacterized protein